MFAMMGVLGVAAASVVSTIRKEKLNGAGCGLPQPAEKLRAAHEEAKWTESKS
jgi:hypothetical protein